MFCLINAQWFVLSNKYAAYTLYVLCVQLSSFSLKHGNLRSILCYWLHSMSDVTPGSLKVLCKMLSFGFCCFFSPPLFFFFFFFPLSKLNYTTSIDFCCQHIFPIRYSVSYSETYPVSIMWPPVLEFLGHCSKLPGEQNNTPNQTSNSTKKTPPLYSLTFLPVEVQS